MSPPPIIDLTSSSDFLCRDIVSRNHAQVGSTGNLIQKNYYHVSGNVASASAAEIVSLDGSNNAQMHFLGRSAAAPLDLAGITSDTTSTWSADNAILSVGRGTSTLRSAGLVVGNLISSTITSNLVNFAIGPGAETKLDNYIVRSFQKNLASTVGHASEICTVQNVRGAYTMELSVVQSETGSSVAKAYKFPVRARQVWSPAFTISSAGVVFEQWFGVTYGIVTSTGLGRFVAVASSGLGNRAMTSTDGLAWTIRSTPANYSWRSVTYGVVTSTGIGLFVAVAFANGSGDRVMTSLNGQTWTTRTTPTTNGIDPRWTSVTYGIVNGNSRFVAVAADGEVMTSSNGENWNQETTPSANWWTSVTFGNGLFVAVTDDPVGSQVMTSSNASTWTLRTTPIDNSWKSVTHGNGLFVAVSSTGAGDRVMTSPNGITWTIRQSAADNDWYSVTHGNGLFVAGAWSGNANRVMTSPDGVTWTIRTSSANSDWGAVAFGAGRYVFVADFGTGGRVMTSIAPTSVEMAADDFSVQPWHRLLPLTSTSVLDIGVDIRVNASTTTLRLVRLSGSVTSNIECIVSVYQSRADPVTITESTQTTTGALINPILYESTRLTQVAGRVGIGTSNPTTTLTVADTTSATSFVAVDNIVTGNIGMQTSSTGLFNDTPLAQGAYMSWNHNSGEGKTDFVCKRGAGTGGFNFMQSNGGGTPLSDGKVTLATINPNGMSSTHFSAPGAIVGSLFATGTDGTLTQGVTISPTTLSRTIHGTGWVTFATLSYTPRSTSSRIFIHFDIDYNGGGGSGTDSISSAIFVGGTESMVKTQQFAQALTAGSGTRSSTIFPISAVLNNTTTTARSIAIRLLLASTDDPITLLSTNYQFEVLERQS